MKILTAQHIKHADMQTVVREPITSLALMERAAEVLAQAVCQRVEQGSDLVFFIGKGNNGGDGLAMARMLSRVEFNCKVCMLFENSELSEDCAANLERLPEEIKIMQADELSIPDDAVIIDAVLGSGLKGDAEGIARELIDLINSLDNTVISVDLPSGMKTEFGNDPTGTVHADITLTLEFPKLAMLLPEAGDCCGEVVVIPIDLDEEFKAEARSDYFYSTLEDIRALALPRPKFGHKGDFGHALLICGSVKMPGAGVLSTLGGLRSGCGLLTVHLPEKASLSLVSNAPSAMLSLDPDEVFSVPPEDMDKYDAVGVGCGLGTSGKTRSALKLLLESNKKRCVIDADALNIISDDNKLLEHIAPDSILTPHPGEFRRLVGDWISEEEKLEKLKALAIKTKCIVVLKGAYTAICSPAGIVYFNSTGTPGMAKGGSGDILTGLLTGLVARGYGSLDAACLGVWLHGRAGEKAADYFTPEGMNSADIVDFISEAWAELISE